MNQKIKDVVLVVVLLAVVFLWYEVYQINKKANLANQGVGQIVNFINEQIKASQTGNLK